MAPIVTHVVADTGAFIANAPLREIAENIYTVPEVISECRHPETRQRLRNLPYQIILKEPSSEAFAAVSTFAKKVGDFSVLSTVDLKVLALTYDLEKQFRGTEHIHTEPKAGTNQQLGGSVDKNGLCFANFNQKLKEGQNIPSSLLEEEDEDEELEDDEKSGNADNGVAAGEDGNKMEDGGDSAAAEEMEEEEEEEEEEDDDDDGWITPSNIVAVKKAMGVETSEEQKEGDVTCVGCLTTDFAMQNVLIQMNMCVLSAEGKLLRRVRTFVLRCHGCFKITKDTSRVFCPHCGNKTMRRLTTSLNEDGSLRYYLARNYRINTRGTIFPLPKPTGGKYARNPVVVEDQPIPQQRLCKKAMQQFDVMSDDLFLMSSPFKHNDVASRSSQLGFTNKNSAYWSKRNPNSGNNIRRKKK